MVNGQRSSGPLNPCPGTCVLRSIELVLGCPWGVIFDVFKRCCLFVVEIFLCVWFCALFVCLLVLRQSKKDCSYFFKLPRDSQEHLRYTRCIWHVLACFLSRRYCWCCYCCYCCYGCYCCCCYCLEHYCYFCCSSNGILWCFVLLFPRIPPCCFCVFQHDQQQRQKHK